MSSIDKLRVLYGRCIKEIGDNTYCVYREDHCIVHSEYGKTVINEYIATKRINDCVIAVDWDMVEDGEAMISSSLPALLYNLRNNNYIKIDSKGVCSIKDEYMVLYDSDIFIIDKDLNFKKKFILRKYVMDVDKANVDGDIAYMNLISTDSNKKLHKIEVDYNYNTKEINYNEIELHK